MNRIYALLRSGEIYSKRIGNKIIIPKCCLIEFVYSDRKDSQQQADGQKGDLL